MKTFLCELNDLYFIGLKNWRMLRYSPCISMVEQSERDLVDAFSRLNVLFGAEPACLEHVNLRLHVWRLLRSSEHYDWLCKRQFGTSLTALFSRWEYELCCLKAKLDLDMVK